MNALLWTLQILLALHTAVGAVWKWKSPPGTMPSLAAIPESIWLGMSDAELTCAVALLLPVARNASAAPIAAVFIVAEMVAFVAVHLASGSTNPGPLFYWGIVAALAAFVVYGRLVLRPIR